MIDDISLEPLLNRSTEGSGISKRVSTVGLLYNSSTGTYLPARADGATSALQCIEYEHHEIHAGSHFFITGYQDLALNKVLDFTFLTPNTTKWIHWILEISTEAETLFQIYEGAVVVNDLANTVTLLNSNRNSLTASGALVKYELQADLTAANVDTNVAAATLIESGISGSGKNMGKENRENELILKQNTLYCLRVTATSAGYVNFKMNWYEHTNII